MALDPVRIWLMDVPKFIRENKCLPVTSVFIRETTTNEFKHDGLFSEDIFGQINTTDRLIRFGYVDLRTKILHPLIYIDIVKLKAFYGEIMARKAYAVFNPDTREFVRASEEDEDADTGYQFFMSHLDDLKFEKNKSLKHNEMVDVIERHQGKLTLEQCLVMPAGLRDLREDEGKPAADSINKLYSSLINYTLALPTTRTTSDIYDNVRFSIQKKVAEIYQYLFDMIEGKFGFFQRKYGSRNLALGTRNVVSTASMAALSPDDPQYLKMDEIKIPLFQLCKMYTPLIIYNIRMLFLNEVFHITSDQVALIDPETNNLVYQPIDEDEKSRFLSSEGIEKMIDLFRDPEFRFTPVVVYNEEGKGFYLYMVYDDTEVIYLTRSVSEVINKIKEKVGVYDPQKLRPLTYAEMFYIVAYRATYDKTSLITRYPAIEVGSEVPNRVHLISTNPARKINLFSTMDDDNWIMLPEYPIINNTFVDSLIPHPQILAGLGMDFDGNCLIGSTRVQIRYTSDWIEQISKQDYNCSGQDISTLIETIRSKSIQKNNFYYAEIRMDEFPQPGLFKYDKNRAKVYEVPEGCYVLSFKNNDWSYEPVTQVTVEHNCDTVEMYVGGRLIQPSTNESLAVFDHNNGQLKRVTPAEGINWLVPYLKKDPTPFGNYGTFDDGWFIGAVLSDGYLTEKYFGYAKKDDVVRNRVFDYLKKKFPDMRINTYKEEPGLHKFGSAVKCHTSDHQVMRFIATLNLYKEHMHRDAISKRIPDEYFRNGSEEFLWGILSGMLDGDGTITFKVALNGGIDFKVRFSTSSPYLRDGLVHLCYKLGLRTTVTTSEARIQKAGHFSKEAYIILPWCEDVQEHLQQINCFGTRENELLCIWDANQKEYHNRRDIVPISAKDRADLLEIAHKTNNTCLKFAMYDARTIGCARYILQQFLPYIKDGELKHRIENRNVCWIRPKLTGKGSPETVYDFEVPTTKVFAVNDGVVVYDTASSNGILSKQANEEVTSYLNSVGRYIHSNGKLMHGTTDLIKLTIFNLSRDPAMV